LEAQAKKEADKLEKKGKRKRKSEIEDESESEHIFNIFFACIYFSF
jgi:hypothetical protein